MYLTEDPEARTKLLKARAEIEDILTRYDLGAVIVLHAAPTSSEFVMRLEPSYSVMKVESDGRVRVESKLENYNGDKEAKRYDLAATANMASSLFELTGRCAIMLGQLSEIIDRHSGAGHSELRQIKPN
jgi:hypothetical protein